MGIICNLPDDLDQQEETIEGDDDIREVQGGVGDGEREEIDPNAVNKGSETTLGGYVVRPQKYLYGPGTLNNNQQTSVSENHTLNPSQIGLTNQEVVRRSLVEGVLRRSQELLDQLNSQGV